MYNFSVAYPSLILKIVSREKSLNCRALILWPILGLFSFEPTHHIESQFWYTVILSVLSSNFFYKILLCFLFLLFMIFVFPDFCIIGLSAFNLLIVNVYRVSFISFVTPIFRGSIKIAFSSIKFWFAEMNYSGLWHS